MTRIVLVHAVEAAIQPIADAFHKFWPEADRANIFDDSLPRDRGSSAGLPQVMMRRFHALTSYAELIGADGLLFTCSAFGKAIESAAKTVRFPVLKPNEAMFETALSCGSRIGMVATFAPAVAPMEEEFREMAVSRGAVARIETKCVPEAMEALRTGDLNRHNALVAATAAEFKACDAVLLAHFSTSVAEEAVAARLGVPVLTSPESAVRKLKSTIAGGDAR